MAVGELLDLLLLGLDLFLFLVVNSLLFVVLASDVRQEVMGLLVFVVDEVSVDVLIVWLACYLGNIVVAALHMTYRMPR